MSKEPDVDRKRPQKRTRAAKAANKGAIRLRQNGDGIWARALLVIGIAMTGTLVAFAILWWQQVQANKAHSQLMAEVRLEQFAGYLNGRIDTLRRDMQARAGAPATIRALTSFDEKAIRQAADDGARAFAFARRVDIIPRGTAEVDLSAEVPISFAALDVIRRAESKEFVGPEVSINQRNQVYVASPITSDGKVAGVLFAVVSSDYFLTPLGKFPKDTGVVKIEQVFAGNSPTTVIQWGTEAQDMLEDLHKPLAVPQWKLTYSPADSDSISGPQHLLMPFALVVGLILGGTMLGFSQLSRKLREDLGTLAQYVHRLLRGRRTRPDEYHLPIIANFAHDLAAGRSGHAVAEASGQTAAATSSNPHNSDGSDNPVNNDQDVSEPLADTDDNAEQVQNAKADAATTSDEDKLDMDDEDDLFEESENDFLHVAKRTAADDNFGIEVTEHDNVLESGKELDDTIFRAYDIRGVTTDNLTEEVVYWIGRAFASEALAKKCPRVVTGRDGRHSSLPLQEALIRGLCESGADVVNVGEVPTPLVYFATHALNTGTGVMITGSHNPPEYNGLKMMIGGDTLAEERIQALKERIVKRDLSEGHGEVEDYEILDHYLDRVIDDVALAQPMKVVLDCGNGVAGAVAPRLFEELGCEVIPLYCDVDGDFPNHHPDPANPANLEDLITVVQAEKADIGLAFDGDGDRVGVVTPAGKIIWPDRLLMLLAKDVVSRNPGADVIYDVKCSTHLNTIISDNGGRPIMWKTGHSHMKAKLKETGALLAGEFSGHIFFGERWYGFDDGIYSGARLLEVLSAETGTVDEVFDRFPDSFTTPEIQLNASEEQKFEIVERLKIDGDFGDGTMTTIDGVRVDYPDGWGLVRASNTSPKLVLRFEAESPEALERIRKVFSERLQKIDAGLVIPG